MSSLRSLVGLEMEIANILFDIIQEFTEGVETRDKDIGVIRVKIMFKALGMDKII